VVTRLRGASELEADMDDPKAKSYNADPYLPREGIFRFPLDPTCAAAGAVTMRNCIHFDDGMVRTCWFNNASRPEVELSSDSIPSLLAGTAGQIGTEGSAHYGLATWACYLRLARSALCLSEMAALVGPPICRCE